MIHLSDRLQLIVVVCSAVVNYSSLVIFLCFKLLTYLTDFTDSVYRFTDSAQ